MELKDFLVKAKKATYANANVEKVASTRSGSNDYEYRDSGMIYHDTFFGGTNFIGEEVVYESSSKKPIWGMNYYGVTLDQNLSEEAMDKALRPALMKVGENDILPVRGPRRFINDNYEYTFNVDGNLERFDGVEEIRKNGELIYRLRCTGGKII
jgi:hypothetical protein